jgi:hypothetical protein
MTVPAHLKTGTATHTLREKIAKPDKLAEKSYAQPAATKQAARNLP